jgi:hypothetical protein
MVRIRDRWYRLRDKIEATMTLEGRETFAFAERLDRKDKEQTRRQTHRHTRDGQLSLMFERCAITLHRPTNQKNKVVAHGRCNPRHPNLRLSIVYVQKKSHTIVREKCAR